MLLDNACLHGLRKKGDIIKQTNDDGVLSSISDYFGYQGLLTRFVILCLFCSGPVVDLALKYFVIFILIY